MVTSCVKVARSAALAPIHASQKMAMNRSSERIAQMLYPLRAPATFSVTSAYVQMIQVNSPWK